MGDIYYFVKSEKVSIGGKEFIKVSLLAYDACVISNIYLAYNDTDAQALNSYKPFDNITEHVSVRLNKLGKPVLFLEHLKIN